MEVLDILLRAEADKGLLSTLTSRFKHLTSRFKIMFRRLWLLGSCCRSGSDGELATALGKTPKINHEQIPGIYNEQRNETSVLLIVRNAYLTIKNGPE